MIDWGYFYFITKNLFLAMDWIYRHVGNFGLAILLITVLIKGVFFPLANKSYASMAKMKAVQPEMVAIRERWTLWLVAQSGGEPVATSPDCAFVPTTR